MFADIPGQPGRRKLGKRGSHLGEPRRIEMERRQVGLREVPVVVRGLLDPHPVGLASRLVPAPGLLDEWLTAIEGRGLTLDLIGDRPLDRTERVHVLDLDPRPERLGPTRPQRDVGLDPHLAVLHVRVRRPDGPEQQLQLLGIAPGLLGRPDLGLGDDLHERRARPIEVDEAASAGLAAVRMDELGRVLLEVGPGDRDRERPIGGLERQAAERGERQIVLADLIALGQVRIEVVLAVPAGRRRHRRIDRQAGRQHVLDGPPVDDRQGARQAEADRAHVAVRRRAVVGRRAAAEHLRRGLQLAVDLDPDDRLVALRSVSRGPRDLDHGASVA